MGSVQTQKLVVTEWPLRNSWQVVMMTPFHSDLSPDNLALASEQGLAIGSIDEIQKLQITSIPLGALPQINYSWS